MLLNNPIMGDICRICLESLEGEYKVSLSDTFKGLRVFKYINSITDIVIKEDDGLPSAMCLNCYREFENVIQFREKCVKSDIKLREGYGIQIKDNIELDFKEEFKSNGLSDNDNSNDELILDLKPITYEYDDNYECETEAPVGTEDLTCDKCYAVFKTAKTLHIHQTKNKCETTKFQCDDCGDIFKSKCKIAVHWKQKHLLSKLICPRCKMSFKTFTAFNNHKLKNTCCKINEKLIHIEGIGKSRVFSCKECSYTTKAVLSIIIHVRSHTGERPHKCLYCPSSFTQIATLLLHQDYKHKTSSLRKEKCNICGKIILGKRRLQKHIARAHKDPVIQCSICNKSLLSRSLQSHMARHAGHKDFTCEVCALSFYTLAELLTHRRKKHKQGKRYDCQLCQYSTHNSILLKNHVKKHEDGSLLCNVCFIFLKDKERLLKHQQIHLEGKVFQCPYCHLKYHTRKSQQSHVKAKHSDIVLSSKINKLSDGKKEAKTVSKLDKELEKVEIKFQI